MYMYVNVCMHVYEEARGRTLGIILRNTTHLLGDRVSYWPGAYQLD